MATKRDRGMVVHRKLLVHWTDLVQFNSPSSFGYRVDDAAAIAIYQWLLREMPAGLRPLLFGLQCENRNGFGYWMHPTPMAASRGSRGHMLDWRYDLRCRFAAVLLATEPSPSLVRWRRRAGVQIDRAIEIPVRNRDFDLAGEAIEQLNALVGRRFAVSPNSVHARATLVYNAYFHIDEDGFSAFLQYGYPSEKKSGSAWHVAIESTPRELFTDFLKRAVGEFEALMTPAQVATP